ncbi:pyridoxal phosphate-dependent aminotransferase [Aquabacterium sp.]|uniref:pyridoxal phosphate-dependent aminotransferase n=1 Tax=Aquabacterium sp. TaxID=1872578 RepID=UPI002C6B6749|nr:pyridoxal phosphate-dependent aminotransferase [Aquabacterium sp.]HSW07029.1 pyridoxal phosphate-dependent aminotransferase [Aquabacterium sp.]
MNATALPRTPALTSRLPNVGTTIFTVMSALATEHGAVNLGQGFPDFDNDPALSDAVTQAMREGLNQYPPMAGVAPLREAVSLKVEALYGHRYDPTSEITVTAGATQGILTAVLACVGPGDEVIVLDPCYDSYVPNIELAGGIVKRVALTAGSFRPDFAAIGAAITPRTRAMIINTPHNPSATIWRAEDMQALAELLRPTEIVLICDEVYEHMVYDGRPHVSAASLPELAARTFVISSFGKTYHVTGWKVGYVAAPAPLMAEFRKVHQFNVFTVNTPMQHGLARFMAAPAPYLELPAFYQRKRDLFREGLAGTRFRLLPSEGSYFQCVDYSAISDLSEEDFCRWLTREIGVAAIPLSAFYGDGRNQGLARFCFAKRDETLRSALERLQGL